MFERTGLYAESWNIAWRIRKGTETILSNKSDSFTVIKNSFRYWAADPFLFEYQGEIYIFAELYDYIQCRGGIGYCKWNGKNFEKWKMVILESYHLSYPYIFKRDGYIYIMPEAGANESLYLYRAIDFPNKWTKEKVLRTNVVYGDTTPLKWEKHSYALTYDVRDASQYKLVLLDLENDKNDRVLKLDRTELRRPAGGTFIVGSEYMRPAQNCVNDYGEGIVLYKYNIEQGLYKEEFVKMIMPQNLRFSKKMLLDGMHTYNMTDQFEVIDIKTRRFNLLNFVFRVIGKIRR